MAKPDKHPLPSAPSYAASAAKRALAVAAFAGAVAVGTGSYMYSHRQDVEQQDHQNDEEVKRYGKKIEEFETKAKALEAVLEKRSDALEKFKKAESVLIAEIRNGALQFNEAHAVEEDALRALAATTKVRTKDVAGDLIGTVYQNKESYEWPFKELAQYLGEEVAESKGISEETRSFFSLLKVPPPPQAGQGEGVDNKKIHNYNPQHGKPYVDRVQEQNKLIEESIVHSLEVVIAVEKKAAGSEEDAARVMFKDLLTRVRDTAASVAALEKAVEADRNRTQDVPDKAELEQHDAFLKVLGEVREQLGHSEHKLQPDAGQNIKLITGRLDIALETLVAERTKLEEKLQEYKEQIKEPEQIVQDEVEAKVLVSFQALVQEQYEKIIATHTAVALLKDFIDGKVPEEKIIAKLHDFGAKANDLAGRLEAVPDDKMLSKAEVKEFQKDMRALIVESNRAVGETRLALNAEKIGKGSDSYTHYERGQNKPKKPLPEPDFAQPEVRGNAIRQLRDYAQEADARGKTWEKVAAGRQQRKQEQQDLGSPEHVRQMVVSTVSEFRKLMESNQRIAAAADTYDETRIEYGYIQNDYLKLLKEMQAKKFDFTAFAKQLAQEEQSAVQQNDAQTMRGFNYREAAPAQRAKGQSGSGWRAEAAQELEAVAFSLEGPTGSAAEVLEKHWPERGSAKDKMSRARAFHNLQHTAGVEPEVVTASRIKGVRKAYALEGQTGVNCLGAAMAGMTAEEKKVFTDARFGLGQINGKKALHPLNDGGLMPGDLIIYQNGNPGHVSHIATTLGVRTGDNGKPLYTIGNGNFNTGNRIDTDREHLGKSPRPGYPVGYVSKKDIVMEVERRKAVARGIESGNPEDVAMPQEERKPTTETQAGEKPEVSGKPDWRIIKR